MAGSSNENIKNALQRIVSAGQIKGVRILTGFATKIYQAGEEGYGTVDFHSSDGNSFIPGVSLSAIRGNQRGMILLPSEDSEMTIVLVDERDAFALSYSHITSALIDADDIVRIGVTGVEAVDDDTDYDEVEKTGLSSYTEHQTNSILSRIIHAKDDIDNENTLSRTVSLTESVVRDNNSGDSTKTSQGTNEIKFEAKNSNIKITPSDASVTSQKITLSAGGATQKAVLGQTLSIVLKAFIDQVASIITTTAIGPQPIINAAAVSALKTQVDTILSNVNLIE